jgi:hypothetical protein
MWVGTESQISYYGSRSPRIESGRAPTGPFDPRNNSRNQDNGGDEASAEETDPDKLPYNVARPTAPRRAQPAPEQTGVDLLNPNNNKSLEGSSGDDGAQDDPDPSPILVGLEPSVLSLATGSETSLQLVARGAPAEPYRIPLTVSFDPARVAIESIATVEGVVARFQDLEPEEGWIELDLEVGAGSAKGAHGLAVLRVRALAPGPVPLVVTAGGATSYDGSTLPVAVGNGALFVTDQPQAVGQ